MTQERLLKPQKGRKEGAKNRFTNRLGLSAAWHEYRRNLSVRAKTDQDCCVKQGEYGDIVKAVCEKMIDRMILGSETVTLPCGLGEMRIRKRPMKGHKMVDWNESHKIGKFVYFLNEHSDGFLMKFFWDKDYTSVANLFYYRFTAAQKKRELLSQTIRSGKKIDYYE